jgi:hypothetical protein
MNSGREREREKEREKERERVRGEKRDSHSDEVAVPRGPPDRTQREAETSVATGRTHFIRGECSDGRKGGHAAPMQERSWDGRVGTLDETNKVRVVYVEIESFAIVRGCHLSPERFCIFKPRCTLAYAHESRDDDCN